MADFYIDHDVARALAVRLRNEGHHAVTARNLGVERAGDERHLMGAALAGRILVTHNAHDYRLLHAAWLHWTETWERRSRHAGILILPHGPAEENVRLLISFLELGLPLDNGLYEWSRRGGWLRGGR
jgi:hypothetical protein